MNTLSERIRQAIVSQGAISFARFMELALYCPVYGYYERERDTIGQAGDYYTNVSVGSLFGELLAFQFAQWLSERAHGDWQTAKTRPSQLVEAGAHDGRLGVDILTWLQQYRPEVFHDLQYWIIEPSARRQAWQEKNLRDFTGKVVWFESVEALPKTGVRGVIFSNELLDAMPRHRLRWDASIRIWFEWGVTIKGDAFDWIKLPDNATDERNGQLLTERPDLPVELSAVLPDGFATEVCPKAEHWWRQAAGALHQGKLLAIDYGLSAEQFFTPERKEGTLRAYHRHRLNNDLLANAGEQDITAHVNFTALQLAGESAGLKTESGGSQAQFLTLIAKQIWNLNDAFGEWTRSHKRQFQTLTHPEHLGRPFRVLLQSR